MKIYLIAYRQRHDTRQLEIVFTLVVHDPAATMTALKLMRGVSGFRWAQGARGIFGIGIKPIAPKPPFDFLPSAFPRG